MGSGPDSNGAHQRWALKLEFVGATPGVKPQGQDPTPAVVSYFKGSREQWKTGLSTYATLVYPDLWPGIDLVYSGTVNRLKYTFLVKPGADPSQIKLAYRGVTAVRLTEAGQLEVSTPVGRFQDDRPVSYQEVDGRRVEVPTAYALDPNATSESQVYGFSLGAYDQEKPLLLDLAVLIYAGYIGGDGSEWGFGIAVDRAGSAYITGGTTSTEATFPVTVGPDLTFNGDWDAFVAKIGELVGVPVSSIVPRSGGDTGPVSVVIHGFGFAEGATAKLVRAGQPDIVGDPVSVSPDGRTITTTFGLTGKALGLWDVVVTDPDGTSATLPEGFTIEEGRAPYVWMDILGWDQIRAGQKATYRIVFGNSGNVDWDGLAFIAIFVPVGIDTVTVKYNTLIVGEFAPQPQSPEALVGNLFSLPRLPALAQQGARLDISFTPPPSVTGGDIKVEVFPVPSKLPLEEDVLGAALLTLIQTKAIELGLEFPPVEELFLEALVKALQEFVIELTKKLVIVGAEDIFLENAPDFSKEAFEKALDSLETSFSAAVQAYRATWTLITEPENWKVYESALYANWKVIQPKFSPPELAPPPVVKPIQVVASRDPNEKVGATGVGEPRYFSWTEPLRYAIFFENVETATAPAQEVVITDQLDVAKMDLSTFSLGLIAFGDKQVTPPPGMSEFTTDVDLRPEKNLLVRITAHVDPPTGLLTWRFTSIDPDTGLPPEDPLVGFLPPNKNPPEGEGNVLFTVMPMPGLPTRTEIRNRARIVFDVNPPMDTPEWLNTLDHTKPESQVVPLAPIQPSSTFEVEWSGTDVGSGIKDYTIFVSEDGGPFTVWLGNITDTSATFTGQPGMPYAFYSVARDQTGNLEEVPPDPDTTTRVTNAPIANAGSDQTVDEGTTVTLDGTGSSDPDGDSLSFEWTQTAGPAVALGGATTATPSFRAPFVSSATTLTFQVTVSDGFASSTDTVVITVQDLGASIRGTVTGSGPIDGARLSAPEPKSHAGHRGGQSPRFHLDPETKGQPP